MPAQYTYSDEQLANAIAAANSWRSTLRGLGLSATSASAIKSVRTHADRLGIRHSHFTSNARWTVEELTPIVQASNSWLEVAARLNLDGGASVSAVRGYAARLGIDTEHLDTGAPADKNAEPIPDLSNLNRSGGLLAAAWYTLCGYSVSWPLEPSRYDLIVSRDQHIRRVQVKTTTVKVGSTWKAYLSTSRRERRVYSVDEIDDFFIITGDFDFYLIPLPAVGGLHAIHLSAYESYRLRRFSWVTSR